MKKKILSLILVFMFVPAIFMFAGCKDKGYKLTKLETDYNSIAESCTNVKIIDNKIVFDYDNYKIGSTKFLSETINNVEPYTNLKQYNVLLDNLMGFVYEYIDVCSNKNIEASKAVRNNLKTEIDELSETIFDIDVYISQWAEVVEFNYNDDVTNSQCLSRYKTLLMGYNDLFQKAINFSNSLSSLYYNNALNDANPRIDNIAIEDFDSSVIISKLHGRVKYEISNLSQIFVEIYVDGNDLPTSLTTPIVVNEGEDDEYVIFNSLSLNQTNFDYLTKVNNLNRVFDVDFDAETAIEIANGSDKKVQFYNLSVEAYNMQNILDNDNDVFVFACEKVQYSRVDNLSEIEQKQCKNIIDNYKFAVEKYYNILNSMLNTINS